MTVDDCNHPDYNFEDPAQPPSPANYQNSVVRLVASQDQTDYERNRKLTGISKPSILEGLLSTRSFPVPSFFTVDLVRYPTCLRTERDSNAISISARHPNSEIHISITHRLIDNPTTSGPYDKTTAQASRSTTLSFLSIFATYL